MVRVVNQELNKNNLLIIKDMYCNNININRFLINFSDTFNKPNKNIVFDFGRNEIDLNEIICKNVDSVTIFSKLRHKITHVLKKFMKEGKNCDGDNFFIGEIKSAPNSGAVTFQEPFYSFKCGFTALSGNK